MLHSALWHSCGTCRSMQWVWWYIDLVRTVPNTLPPCECLQSVPLKALSWQYATFARLGKAQRDFSALMRCSGHVCGTRSFGEENEMRLSGYDMLCPNFWGNSEVTSMMVCRAKYPNKAGLIDHLPRSNEKLFFITSNYQQAIGTTSHASLMSGFVVVFGALDQQTAQQN